MFKKKRSYEPERRLMQNNLRIDKRLRLPLPQRYQTTLECQVIGNVPVNGLGATGFLILPVKANDMHLPFSTGAFGAGATFALSAAASGLTVATLAPAGYGNFMQSSGKGFYKYSRVLASKISACITPTAGADALSMCILPQPATGTVVNSIISAGAAPFSKGPIQCTGNNNTRMNRLTNYISAAQWYGVPPSAIKIEDNYEALANNDNPNNFLWYIILQGNDNLTNSAIIGVDVRIKYYVEFLSDTVAGLLDVEV